jgi:hypothetical protein
MQTVRSRYLIPRLGKATDKQKRDDKPRERAVKHTIRSRYLKRLLKRGR